MLPDLAGFQQAGRELRENLGQDVVFLTPLSVTFPPDVAVDPETGEPFDPVLAAQGASAVASAGAKCTVAFRSSDQEAAAGALGWVEGGHVMLEGDPELGSAIASATAVLVRDERFEIIAQRRDPGLAERYLVWGRRA